MNSLAEYTILLSRRRRTTEEKRAALRGEAKAFLARLEEVDGDRRERYRDLGAFSGCANMAEPDSLTAEQC